MKAILVIAILVIVAFFGARFVARKKSVSPILLSEFQELYNSGNELSQAIKTGINPIEFEGYSVKMRARLSSIQKLLPPDAPSELKASVEKLDSALAVTQTTWDICRREIKDHDDIEVTTSDHGSLFLEVAALVDQNPYGAKMAISNGVTTEEISDPLSGKDHLMGYVNNRAKYWVVDYKDVNDVEHTDIPMLLTLCDGYYGSLEKEILPLIR